MKIPPLGADCSVALCWSEADSAIPQNLRNCSRALCGNEDDIIFAKNLWDCKENQLLTQPQRWLCSECYRQTLLWGWWDIAPVSGTG